MSTVYYVVGLYVPGELYVHLLVTVCCGSNHVWIVAWWQCAVNFSGQGRKHTTHIDTDPYITLYSWPNVVFFCQLAWLSVLNLFKLNNHASILLGIYPTCECEAQCPIQDISWMFHKAYTCTMYWEWKLEGFASLCIPFWLVDTRICLPYVDNVRIVPDEPWVKSCVEWLVGWPPSWPLYTMSSWLFYDWSHMKPVDILQTTVKLVNPLGIKWGCTAQFQCINIFVQ